MFSWEKNCLRTISHLIVWALVCLWPPFGIVMQQLATDMLGLGAYMDDAGLSPACNMLFSLTQNCFYKYPVPYHR